MAAIKTVVRQLGLIDYSETYAQMRDFTAARGPDTADQLWFLEHPPVFTQGQAGKAEHVLAPGDIPIVQSNRGGQVTYHGPGQAVVYVLLDLHRLGYGARDLVRRLEQAMIETLAGYGIAAQARPDAPGVYVERDWADGPRGQRPEQRKIGSLGLRVSRGCSYHGIALNVDMDLEPFGRINPCGLAGMRMTQVSELGGPADLGRVMRDLEAVLLNKLGPTSL
ncbi:MAG TPA: lipoyl(octanoyl) transferase LipB [Nevskia sp.]|nr:lipoyl(octanoyl) transferase LipB [Nevskia sp.]